MRRMAYAAAAIAEASQRYFWLSCQLISQRAEATPEERH